MFAIILALSVFLSIVGGFFLGIIGTLLTMKHSWGRG